MKTAPNTSNSVRGTYGILIIYHNIMTGLKYYQLLVDITYIVGTYYVYVVYITTV